MPGPAALLATWREQGGAAPRGTLVLVPGRGEQPLLYARFGRRIASAGYRVHAAADPAQDPGLVLALVSDVLAAPGVPAPVVLAGSDTGALFVAGLAATGRVPAADALVLAALPVPGGAPGPGGRRDALAAAPWEEELEARTACPAHRARLAAAVRRGALYQPVPAGWTELADLRAVALPLLGIHGTHDRISPLATAGARYAAAARAEFISVAGGRHDVLNDVAHRTVATAIVLFLERLRRARRSQFDEHARHELVRNEHVP